MATPVLEAEVEVNPDVLLYNKATAIGKGGHDWVLPGVIYFYLFIVEIFVSFEHVCHFHFCYETGVLWHREGCHIASHFGWTYLSS